MKLVGMGGHAHATHLQTPTITDTIALQQMAGIFTVNRFIFRTTCRKVTISRYFPYAASSALDRAAEVDAVMV